MTKLFINFEEILLFAHLNFEKQDKVLESSINIINYSIICINSYCIYTILIIHI